MWKLWDREVKRREKEKVLIFLFCVVPLCVSFVYLDSRCLFHIEYIFAFIYILLK